MKVYCAHPIAGLTATEVISYYQFIKEVYNYQILGIVSTDIVDSYGNSICELDSDQRSEEERLKSFLI